MIFFQQSASADKGMTGRHPSRAFDTISGAPGRTVRLGALIAGAALAGHTGATFQGLAGAGLPGAPGGVRLRSRPCSRSA